LSDSSNARLDRFKNMAIRLEAMAQTIQHLPSWHEAQNLNPSAAKKNEKKIL
jgi:hypothetical protein